MFGPRTIHNNPYRGDAVSSAQYRRDREAWERSGRRGPPPTHPRQANRNPVARISRTRGVKTMKGPYSKEEPWIKHRGTLGEGFLTDMDNAEREEALDKCVSKWGYRSCLGKVMALERAKRGPRGVGAGVGAKYANELRHARKYLVSTYGGPGSFGPREQVTPLRRANPPPEQHLAHAESMLHSALSGLEQAQEKLSAASLGGGWEAKGLAQEAFDDAARAQRDAHVAAYEFEVVGEIDRRDAAHQVGRRAFETVLSVARAYDVYPDARTSNPPSHVHRGHGANLLSQAEHYADIAEKAEKAGDMGTAWDAIRHSECDIRMAYSEFAYAGGVARGDLAKLEDAYETVKAQKERLRKARGERNPKGKFSREEAEVLGTLRDFAEAEETLDVDYTFWTGEPEKKAAESLVRQGYLVAVDRSDDQITVALTSKGMAAAYGEGA